MGASRAELATRVVAGDGLTAGESLVDSESDGVAGQLARGGV